MMATAMTERNADRELGPGERATLARQRYQRNFLIGCMLFGGLIGGAIAIGSEYSGGLFEGLSRGAIVLHPVVAIILAIGMAIGLVVVPAYSFRTIDEVKIKRNHWSMTAGWFTVIGGYPAWAMLAAGGLAPPPSALILFAAVYVVTMIAYAIQWLRG